MAKTKVQVAESQDEVLGKKARKRKAKAAAREQQQQQQRVQQQQQRTQQPEGQPEDAMSQCALLCQDNRWREAAMLVKKMTKKAERDGKNDLAAGLTAASKKIEYSLRRQMAAALIDQAQGFLKKEYLLDVG